MFQGSMVALVTPMHASGELDLQGLEDLIERQISAGTTAIVANGTTGEEPTLTEAERQRLIKRAVEISAGRVPIIAGTGSNATASTIEQTEQALHLGADACLVVTPYYNRPTQEGLYQHYRALAEAVSIPIIIYNNPARTGCDISAETVGRLSHISNIVALKDASGDVRKLKPFLNAAADRMRFYTGDDPSVLAFMLEGGHGNISVVANIAPERMRELCSAVLVKNFKEAEALDARLRPLYENLFVEANPIPVKWAAQQLGWIKEGIRLPLTPLSAQYHAALKAAMQFSGVL